MGVKPILISGKWYIRVNWHRRRVQRICKKQSEQFARETAEQVTLALRLYGEKALEMLSGPKPTPKKIIPTIATYGQRFIDGLASTSKRHETIRSAKTQFNNAILPALGQIEITALDYSTLKDWVVQIGKTRRQGSVKKAVQTLRVIMREAVRERIVIENPVKDLSEWIGGAQPGKEVVDPFTLAEIRLIEDAAYKWQPELWHPFIVTLARTGMRIGEARALQIGDIDWASRTVSIARNMPGSYNGIEPPKTQSSRRLVDMSNDLVVALRSMLARRREAFLQRGVADIPSWLFLNHRNVRPVHYSEFINRIWPKVLSKAGLRYRNPHSLRHTFASLLLSQGEDIGWVSRQLGHKSIAVTLGTYSHWVRGTRHVGADGLDRNSGGNANSAQSISGGKRD